MGGGELAQSRPPAGWTQRGWGRSRLRGALAPPLLAVGPWVSSSTSPGSAPSSSTTILPHKAVLKSQ